jgi:hypothetical protein
MAFGTGAQARSSLAIGGYESRQFATVGHQIANRALQSRGERLARAMHHS